MNIGNIKIEKGAALAPMAGLTDAALRKVCAQYGAGYTISEMVSAKALTFGDEKSNELCRHAGGSAPFGIQLFGSEPSYIAQGARLVMKYKPDFIDFNMGCPAPKITQNGAGSALMKDPRLCGEIVDALVKAVDVPITVKIRKGFDDSSITAVEVAKRCEAAGAAAIAVHGRTREQMYHPPVDLNIISLVKKAVSIPVIGNGDVTSLDALQQMLTDTGCDYVMVGRGALGCPWFFSEIKAYLNGEPVPKQPSLYEKLSIMKKQIYDMCEIKGERNAMCQARTHAAWYMKGLKGAARLRNLTSSLTYYEDIEHLAEIALEINRK